MLNDGNGLHHFNFDLDRGIRSQVVEKLGNSPLLPLEKRVGPRASESMPSILKTGLFTSVRHQKKSPKASELCAPACLSEHVGKIGARENLPLSI